MDREELVPPAYGGGSPWSEFRSWSRLKKCIILGILICSAVVMIAGITLIVIDNKSTPEIPTPAPVISSTTMPTTTTPTTTTSSTTTTTPTTTTALTTTTPTPTTTSNATTTTTTPSTTTGSATTTLTPTTSNAPTTTPTSSTTAPYPTRQPLPPNPYELPPFTLLMEEGLDPKYVHVSCFHLPILLPVFREGVFLANPNMTFYAESNTRDNARTLAARMAVVKLFGIPDNYPTNIPKPIISCLHW